MGHTAIAALVTLALALHTPAFSISGVVRVDKEPVAGVTITISGPQGSRTLITDESGEYRLDNLPAGTYRVGAVLVGFREQARDIVLTANAAVDFGLEVDILAEVLGAVPSLVEALESAENLVRLRIERELPPEPCGKVVAAIHTAAVIESMKATFPARIRFGLDSAGTCLDGTRLVKGIGTRALTPGEEYVVFLKRIDDRFESVGGRSLMFPVEHGLIQTGGYPGMPAHVTSLAEFHAAVRRLPR